ncbi:hypothetical protein ACTU3I_15420 [Microbacterium sp. RD1]|uniref:hypothetical protein n=1 Tax=Microbacterium sp. RD1 TaxID=3457313 RepID=UPI003FA58F43
MSRTPGELPPGLLDPAFSTRRSAKEGVTRARTRASDLAAPFYGTRLPRGVDDLPSRCAARATRLPLAAVFSHATAALLWDLPLPWRLERSPILHVSTPPGRRAPQGKTTRGHQVDLPAGDVTSVDGVRVTTPARTFCDLASVLDLPVLVAVGDRLLARGDATITELTHAVLTRTDKRFAPLLRRALELLDERSESPKESELRVLLCEAGLPAPEVNHVVYDSEGVFVARVDLAYVAQRIAVEYEGDHHRDPAQWRRDLARRRRLEALGWTYLTVTQADLTDPTAFFADLTAALARRVA